LWLKQFFRALAACCTSAITLVTRW